MMKLSIRRMVQWRSCRIVELSEGGVVESSNGRKISGGSLSGEKMERWSCRIVEWWSLDRRMVEWWISGVVESSNSGVVE